MNIYKNGVKRTLDFCIVLAVLLIIWPILLLITIWLHFANRGAGAFFTQERPGKDGKIFKVIKFKTMTDERDADGNLLPDAALLTKVRHSLKSSLIMQEDMFLDVFAPSIAAIFTFKSYGIIRWAQANDCNICKLY